MVKNLYYLFIMLILFIVIINPLNVSADEDKSLFIVIHDSETNLPIEEDLFFEGKKYDIAIGCFGEYGYVYNVTLDIPWAGTYITNEELPWITIETPNFEEYPEFIITASKAGYETVEQEIGVLKGRLSLTTDRGIVKEKGSFSVTVCDQNGEGIEGCVVYIDGFESDYASTGPNGITYISAPEINENTQIDINAFKGGYLAGKNTIRVESVSENIIPESWHPIFASSIVVLLTILFVRIRKKLPKMKKDKIKKPVKCAKIKQNFNKHDFKRSYNFKEKNYITHKKTINPTTIKGPWIEEIRLQRTDKKRETKLVENKNKKPIISNKKHDCEWFKGKNYMRYKIDELTGEIDIKNDGKWFEGIDEIKSKVDKRLRDNRKNASKGE